ncbi:MAG: hypothetical protein J07HX64_00820 [halophilic archaeon J07HX64]|nr:MAG: hypothetical protein J07HX64_00820 [halophilic archaeon J07HX64]
MDNRPRQARLTRPQDDQYPNWAFDEVNPDIPTPPRGFN